MQATATTRRFDPVHIKKAALAVGLLTSLALGATTASIVRDTPETNSGAAALTAAAATHNEMASYAFQEQNLNLPTAGRSLAADSTYSHQFMEQNLYLPGGNVQPAVIGYDAMRFREMNELPESIAPAAANWQVIEQNSWGEDFDFETSGGDALLPSPDDVPQRIPGVVLY